MDYQLFESLDHIAFAVKNIEKYRAIFKILGLSSGRIKDVEEEDVKICDIDINGIKIEFVSPRSEESRINNFINKRGETFHHICFRVKNIEEKMKVLRNKGFSFTEERPKLIGKGKKILFIHPRSTGGILIELVQEN